MNSWMQRIALVLLLAAVAGCSTVKDATSTVGGWIGGGDGTLATSKSGTTKASNSGPLLKYAATMRVNNYVDQRKVGSPRYLGQLTVQVRGVSGHELMTDQSIAAIATSAIKKRFDTEGFQVMEGISANDALFDVSGVVKELTLDVKERDYITIAIETTVKEVATGKVVWSGLVTEKHDRFAGISGNSMDDVIDYLNDELRIASGKTVDAISASIMAARPDLFNLTPGTKAVPGVTVYVAPTIAKPQMAPVVPVMPGQVAATGNVPVSTYTPHASDTAGLLLVSTNPARAKIYLDGVYYGLSPLRLEMEPGIHSISVKLPGYNMVTEKVSVRRGDNTELELNLER